MKTEISKSQFKAHALEIFRRVELTGEPVIVTNHGAPTLIVKKYSAPKSHVQTSLKGSVLSYDTPFEPVADMEWDAIV